MVDRDVVLRKCEAIEHHASRLRARIARRAGHARGRRALSQESAGREARGLFAVKGGVSMVGSE